MSVIALKWAYSQKIGNAIAKNILAFLASHNFAGDQSCFKIRTISAATEYDERSVKRGLLLLAEKNLILKKPRFAENGQQLSNEYTLNIPNEYKDDFYSSYGVGTVDKSTGGVTDRHPPHDTQSPPGVTHSHPLNSNNINNNINKKLLAKNDQKQNNAVDNKPPVATRQAMKAENEKKPAWAEKPKSPFSDPTKQSTSYQPPTEEPKEPNPEIVNAAMLALPRHMRPKRFREIDTGVQAKNNST